MMLAVGMVMCHIIRTHPYSAHAWIAKIIPSICYEYSANAPDYKNALSDLQSRQIEAAKSVGLRDVPSTRKDIPSMMDQLVKIKKLQSLFAGHYDAFRAIFAS